MDKFLQGIVNSLWVYMEPKLEKLITDVIDSTLETWGPKIGKIIDDNLEAWLPRIIKAIIIATSQAVRGIAVDSEDKLTDMIPGEIDDAVFDPIVKRISDTIGKLGL
jgi:hypothetical protein